MNLSKSIKVTVVEATAAAGTSALTSDVLDMSGYDGVLFIALTGDVTDTSVLSLIAKGNTANSDSSPTPTTIATAGPFTADASTGDSKVLMVDVYRPQQRYVFASLTRTTANAVIGGIIAIQYCASNKPTSQHASVIASAFAVGA